MIALAGVSLVPGLAVGLAMVVRPSAAASPAGGFRDGRHDLATARRAAALELRRHYDRLPEGAARDILRAHLTLLDDRLLTAEIERQLGSDATPEEALARAAASVVGRFESLGDPRLRARAADVRDVCDCIARHLTNAPSVALPSERRIVCASDLSPAQVLQLADMPPLAFVLERGSEISHAAILMRALGVPAVISLAGVLDTVTDGDQVLVDGDRGAVVVRPEQSGVPDATAAAIAPAADREPTVTSDGIAIAVTASISGAADLQAALASGAEGVGLFRTEWLFLRGDRLPNEQEQADVYQEIARVAGDRPITVRAVDLGGDKQPRALPLHAEANPALGRRGVRLVFDRPELLTTQVRALARAFAGRSIRFLLPMVNDPGDVLRARDLMIDAVGPQAARGFDLGVMIETPAAALMVEELAALVSFISVGTNDLTQYVLAADREGPADLYQPQHPAVLRLVRDTVAVAGRAGKPVSVCGEAARDPLLIPLLIAFGVGELSVAPHAIVRTKRLVRSISAAAARVPAAEVVALPTAAAVLARLRDIKGGACTRDV